MGLVLNFATAQKDLVHPQQGTFFDMPGGRIDVVSALIEPGRVSTLMDVAPMTGSEIFSLVQMLDRMTLCPPWSKVNELLLLEDNTLVHPESKDTLRSLYIYSEIARIVAEELRSILVLVRIVAFRNHISFAGQNACGPQLTIKWLKESDIKGPLNSGDPALIPTQCMSMYAGVIHMGVLTNNWKEILSDDEMRFTFNGVPMQVPYDINRPVTFFEKPILVPPGFTQRLEFIQKKNTVESQPKLISLLVCRAQDIR